MGSVPTGPLTSIPRACFSVGASLHPPPPPLGCPQEQGTGRWGAARGITPGAACVASAALRQMDLSLGGHPETHSWRHCGCMGRAGRLEGEKLT